MCSAFKFRYFILFFHFYTANLLKHMADLSRSQGTHINTDSRSNKREKRESKGRERGEAQLEPKLGQHFDWVPINFSFAIQTCPTINWCAPTHIHAHIHLCTHTHMLVYNEPGQARAGHTSAREKGVQRAKEKEWEQIGPASSHCEMFAALSHTHTHTYIYSE